MHQERPAQNENDRQKTRKTGTQQDNIEKKQNNNAKHEGDEKERKPENVQNETDRE